MVLERVQPREPQTSVQVQFCAERNQSRLPNAIPDIRSRKRVHSGAGFVALGGKSREDVFAVVAPSTTLPLWNEIVAAAAYQYIGLEREQLVDDGLRIASRARVGSESGR